jgi:hypothetical protein
LNSLIAINRIKPNLQPRTKESQQMSRQVHTRRGGSIIERVRQARESRDRGVTIPAGKTLTVGLSAADGAHAARLAFDRGADGSPRVVPSTQA